MAELITKDFSLQEFKSIDTEGSFRGILSSYGNEDLVGDICDEGCWDESVRSKGGQFPLLWQHYMSEPIGSFKVVDTSSALVIEGHFNLSVQRGREAYALLEAGDVKGLSVGFNLEDWMYDADGVRHIKKADLWEGSFVTFPANPAAYAEAKAMAQKNGAILRKGLSALPEFKSLTEEQQEKILRAIDEAVSEEAPEDEAPEDEQKDEGEPEETEPEEKTEGEEDLDGSEDDSEEMKAISAKLLELKNNARALALDVKEVKA